MLEIRTQSILFLEELLNIVFRGTLKDNLYVFQNFQQSILLMLIIHLLFLFCLYRIIVLDMPQTKLLKKL